MPLAALTLVVLLIFFVRFSYLYSFFWFYCFKSFYFLLVILTPLLTSEQVLCLKSRYGHSVQFSHSLVSDSLRPHGLQASVHHQLLELTQTHVHQVSDAIQPTHLLSSPSPPAFNPSQHQGLFRWVSSSHQVAQVLEFQLHLLRSFSSVAQSCLTLCDPMNHSTPGLPVHHQLPESTQTHVHWVSDAIQQSHPLSSPSPPALNLSQHQGLFQRVSSSHQGAKVLEFQLQNQSFLWTPRTDLL